MVESWQFALLYDHFSLCVLTISAGVAFSIAMSDS